GEEGGLRRAGERGHPRPSRQRHGDGERAGMTTVAPFGAWRSPLSAERVAAASLGLGGLAVDGDAIWWIEGRPTEQGRAVLVCWRPGTEPRDAIPPPLNARTRGHESGGGSLAVADGSAC